MSQFVVLFIESNNINKMTATKRVLYLTIKFYM